MKKGLIFTVVKILACGIMFVNAIFGLFYIRGFYYFGEILACMGILCVLCAIAGIIINEVQKRRDKKVILYNEEDEFEEALDFEIRNSTFEIFKLSKLAENLYVYVNYDKEAEQIASEGGTIEDRDYYEIAVIASLEDLFEGKSEEEVKNIILSLARKI